MRLTKRDIAVVLAVHRHRFLTAPQIEGLLFQSSRPRGCQTSCQRRLQLLFHHGYLARLFPPVVMGEGRAPFAYALDQIGVAVVANALGQDPASIQWRVTQNAIGYDFVSHRLALSNFRVAVELLCNQTELNCTVWLDELAFKSKPFNNRVPSRMRGARVIRNFPDGYFQLAVPGTEKPAHFFLEIDQGTMSHSRWKEKILAYIEYRDRGLSERYFGTRNFRLLTVTSSERRAKGLRRTTESAGADHRFWFTAQNQIDIWQPGRLLEPIWHVATREQPAALLPR